MNKDIEFYNTTSVDSMSWLDNSDRLKYSADIIQKEFQELIKPLINGQCDYSNEDKIVALWNSYFLIIGFAFENLIKGLSIEYNRNEMSFQDIFKSWKEHKNGHGISNIAKDILFDISDDDIKLLEKLETYSIWAGRYPLPTNQNNYLNEKNNLSYCTNEKNEIDTLFLKIKNRIKDEYEENENI